MLEHEFEKTIFPLITTIFACTFNKPVPSLGITKHSTVVIWGPVLVQLYGQGYDWLDAYAHPLTIDVADIHKTRIMLNPRAVQVTPRRVVKCQFLDEQGWEGGGGGK